MLIARHRSAESIFKLTFKVIMDDRTIALLRPLLERVDRFGAEDTLGDWLKWDETKKLFAHIEAKQTQSYTYGLLDERRIGKQVSDQPASVNTSAPEQGHARLHRTGRISVNLKPGYGPLLSVLCEALDQAQQGKGAERHNLSGDTPFDRQRMQTVSELVGSPDGMVYQAIKKLTEGMKLPTIDRQVAELLGAINYIAGIVVYLRKRETEATLKPLESWNQPCQWSAPGENARQPERPHATPQPTPGQHNQP